MEVSGKIKVIGETQTFGASGFRKREVVIETFDQYPQPIMVEFVQDNTLLLDQYQLGQEVRIFINLRGREWVNPEGISKYFNSIQGWRLELYNQDQPSTPAAAPAPATKGGDNNEDDLPF